LTRQRRLEYLFRLFQHCDFMAKANPSPSGESSIASFESSLKELEAIVQSMEAGEAPLEAALASYERGVALVRQCQETLAAVERKLQVLENGTLRDADLVDGDGPERP
jgi:exodeoxyribonuclease VII small subunit